MKKNHLFFCKILPFLLYSMFAYFTYADSKEEILKGYNEFPWGTKLEDVQKKYSLKPANTKDKEKYGSESYSVLEEDFERLFCFLDDKLYAVTIVWNKIDYQYALIIANNLRKKYGVPSNDFSSNAGLCIFWNFGDDFVINMCATVKDQKFSILINYYNPKDIDELKFREEEYKKEQLKEKERRLDL